MCREHNHYFQNTVRVGCIFPQPSNQQPATQLPVSCHVFQVPDSLGQNPGLSDDRKFELSLSPLQYHSYHYEHHKLIRRDTYVNTMSGYRSENPGTIPGKDTFFSVPCNNQNIPIQQFTNTASLS